MNILERVRFSIAIKLNNNSESCWANLVLWAVGYQSLFETFGANGNWKNQRCNPEDAYCGKCSRKLL